MDFNPIRLLYATARSLDLEGRVWKLLPMFDDTHQLDQPFAGDFGQ